MTVTAALDGDTTFGEDRTVTVAVGAPGDTAEEGIDYATVADVTITIGAGASSGSARFTLTPSDNDRDEPDKTLSLQGTLAGLTVTGETITITDDDAAILTLNNVPTVSLACNPCVTHPHGEVTFTAVAKDQDGDPLVYSWDASSGRFSAREGLSARWIAPADPGKAEVRVEVSDGRGGTASATAVIEIRNRIPTNEWLARFARTAADQVVSAVDHRLSSPRRMGFEGRIAGHRLDAGSPAGGIAASGQDKTLSDGLWSEDRYGPFGSRGTMTERDVLQGTSFALTAGSEEDGFGTVWGRGAVSRFDGRAGSFALDGEIASAMVGADWSHEHWTVGLVASHSRGDGGWRSVEGEGEVEAKLSGVYPYGRWQASDRVSLWGVAGYGEGTLALESEDGDKVETDMDLAMGAVGLHGVLVAASSEGGVELAVETDALVVRASTEENAPVEVTRLRGGLEGAWRDLDLGAGQLLSPSLEVGLRHDGGDAETGFGLDFGTGVVWSDPERGLRAELRARGLLTHEDADFREMGFSGDMTWDPRPSSERGPKLTLRQAVGASTASGVDVLLARDTLAGLEANDDGATGQRRFEAQLGYGLPMFGGAFTGTPEIGIGFPDSGRDYTIAWSLSPEQHDLPTFQLGIEAARRESANDNEPEHAIGLQLNIRW